MCHHTLDINYIVEIMVTLKVNSSCLVIQLESAFFSPSIICSNHLLRDHKNDI